MVHVSLLFLPLVHALFLVRCSCGCILLSLNLVAIGYRRVCVCLRMYIACVLVCVVCLISFQINEVINEHALVCVCVGLQRSIINVHF